LKPRSSLSSFLDEMTKYGEIGSYFYQPKKRSKKNDFGQEESLCQLTDFLDQNKFSKNYDGINSLEYRVLDRLEFKKSLTSKYVEGGIYGVPTLDHSKALEVVSQLIDDIFPFNETPKCDDQFFAYKIISYDWCDILTGAINWSYVVHSPRNRRWWFLFYNSDS